MAKVFYNVKEIKLPAQFLARGPVYAVEECTVIARCSDRETAAQIASLLTEEAKKA